MTRYTDADAARVGPPARRSILAPLGAIWYCARACNKERRSADGRGRSKINADDFLGPTAFEVRDELEQIGFPLLRDHKGHPSLRSLVHDGYEVVTF